MPPGFADAIGWLVPVVPGDEPGWKVTFTVSDRDATVARAVELGATVVDDADFDAGDGLADGRQALLEHRLVAVQREAVVVGSEEGDGAARLGEAVRVHEVGLGHEVQRALEHRRVHARPAVGQVAQRRHPRLGIARREDVAEARGLGAEVVEIGLAGESGHPCTVGEGTDDPRAVYPPIRSNMHNSV